MKIGVDLDGVCYNFENSLRRYFADHHPHIDTTPEVDTWHFYKNWGLTHEQFVTLCNQGADAGYIFSGPIYRGVARGIQQMIDYGHTIHIITNRYFGTTPKVSEDITKEWLAEHGVPYDTLTFSKDKTVVRTDMFIEDNLDNYDAIDATGSEVWLINRPWNQVLDTRRRVNKFSEFVAKTSPVRKFRSRRFDHAVT